MPPSTPPANVPNDKGGPGPIIGAVIIVVLLLVGALYFWGESLDREPTPLPLIPGDPIE